MPLSLACPSTGTYTLHAAQLLNFGAGEQPFLRDVQLGTLTDLSQHPRLHLHHERGQHHPALRAGVWDPGAGRGGEKTGGEKAGNGVIPAWQGAAAFMVRRLLVKTMLKYFLLASALLLNLGAWAQAGPPVDGGPAPYAPLPVELTAFTATAEGPAPCAAWATASEKNSQAFEVERSTDGRSFARLGTVAAAGAAAAPRGYELLDAKLPAGAALLYYRLKQVDTDGTLQLLARAQRGAEGRCGRPKPCTPTRPAARPRSRARARQLVTVFDALGRPVLSAPADATGTAALVLPAGLPAGYVVRAGLSALHLTVE